MSRTPLQSWSLTRKTIVALGLVVLTLVSYSAIKWVRRDITYWSRSVTFTYKSDTLEQCARLVALNLPGASVSDSGKEIALRVPGQEDVIVKPTSRAQEARLVVFGHSKSISKLGPASEESVKDFLRQMTGEFAKWCSAA